MRISDWSSDVCSSDLNLAVGWRFRLSQRRARSAALPPDSRPRVRYAAAAAEGTARQQGRAPVAGPCRGPPRSEEHTSELQSLMRISYAVFCLKKKKSHNKYTSICKNK